MRAAAAARRMEESRRSSRLTEALKPKKAYSYIRFSTPEQEKGDSTRRQTEAAEWYAKEHGLELDTELELRDLGVSAFHGKNAAVGALKGFLRKVEDGFIEPGSYLLVENLDRISRAEPETAIPLFLQLINEDIVLVTLMDRKEYRKGQLNYMDMMLSLTVFWRGHEESVAKSNRGKAAWYHKRNIATDKPLTAMVPNWLKLNKETGAFEVIEDRAAVVERIFRMTLQGKGQNNVAVTLNKEQVPVFGRAKLWSDVYVRSILTNPAVIGTFTPHVVSYENNKRKRTPQESIKGYYPAIITEGLWMEVSTLLSSKAPLRGRHSTLGTIQNVFGGLALCPSCGSSMIRKTLSWKPGHALVCRKAKAGAGCKYEAVPYEQAEAAFLKNVRQITSTVGAGNKGTGIDDRLDEVEASLLGTSDAIENLMKALETGKAPATVIKRIEELEDSMEQLKQERDELLGKQQIAKGDFLEHSINQLKNACQDPENINKVQVNTLLRQLLNSIVVNWKTGCLELNWKHGAVSEIMYTWPKEA